MDQPQLIPQPGCWVVCEHREGPGIVMRCQQINGKRALEVRWLKARQVEVMPVERLRCGFQIGMMVQDVPLSRTRRSLGEGVIIKDRLLGGREQLLVEFAETGDRHWLPFENLKGIKGIRQRFVLSQIGEEGNAERLRLRCLAYALELWNENTGALSRLDIDPLPHQIHLVHHILASGNLNWMIADDVGLGKTIEVGMLLSALVRKQAFRRILLVTPAGLVKQWQDELHGKFGFDDFMIYGNDFEIHNLKHWKLYDHVIGSVDRFKSDMHLDKLLNSGYWDLVVFDEAHNLSRIQAGMTYKSTERYRLAAALRRKTDSVLLLTATPHQGKQDKFQSLLELIRPEWKPQIRTLAINPLILRKMVVRNNKADVTDAEGRFIFQGKITRAIPVAMGEEERSFDRRLSRYLKTGYAAGRNQGGHQGRAIGFVMTIYRKLAASSAAAIHQALVRRLRRLETADEQMDANTEVEPIDVDQRFIGEWEERLEGLNRQFFTGEINLVRDLIGRSEKLQQNDSKGRIFLDEMLEGILNANPAEKVLIFTEYRATQAFITNALTHRYGQNTVAMIHGGQTFHERERAIDRFETNGQFLVSTEAGGEGINLQRNCHIMVNYDLPWNPMRLVQRVGRLYRYGQQREVVVFNLQSPDSLDGSILDLLYQRIDQVVRDMSVLGDEFKPGLEAEILGEIADVLDVAGILEDALTENKERTKENLEAALERARKAVKLQRELLSYAAGYNPEETKGQIRITGEHLKAFVVGMLTHLGIEIVNSSHGGQVLTVRIPDNLVENYALKRSKAVICFRRAMVAGHRKREMMDFDSFFFKMLIAEAKRYRFDGRVAGLEGMDASALITAVLRWQNDQGVRLRQEYAAEAVHQNGSVEHNPEWFSKWLMAPISDRKIDHSQDRGTYFLKKAEKAMHNRLADISNQDLHPESIQPLAAGWCRSFT